MNIKITHDNSAAVNQDLFWLPVDKYPPPQGVKLLLIDRKQGVLTVGPYSERYRFTHWQACPKFKE